MLLPAVRLRLPPSLLDAIGQPCDPVTQAHVRRSCERATHELLLASLAFGLAGSVGIVFILRDRVPYWMLAIWLGSRVLISLIRGAHASYYLRHADEQPVGASLMTYRILAALDGLAWGAMGWALTPIFNLEIAVVTISMGIGVAAMGTFMLHVDLPSASAFIAPILLPNALYALTRQDDLGLFCAVSMSFLTIILLMEALRANRRVTELLRLRFQSDQVMRTQAEALKQAQALSETRSRFLATMSHEMRTPLHGILGLVRLLRQEEQRPKALQQLDLIRGSGDHLVNVIGDILDFSRMEAGTLPLHRQAFNLQGLMQEVADTSRVIAQEKGLTLELLLDIDHAEEVWGDPVRIRQILHNLLGNGIKFTAQGFVRLHARRGIVSGGDVVIIDVHDSGIGIPEAELPLVFEAFHQAEGTYQRRFGGSGLGLTISRELCRAMGGELSCRSEVGLGSVFTFTLPLPRHTSPAASDPVTAAHAQATGATPDPDAGEPLTPADEQAPHVLLVEDNPVNALVAEAELHHLGIQVTVIPNGRDALEWLMNHHTDLVLMDCEMPEMDGFEATRCIRDQERMRSRTPVCIVALTANGCEGQTDRYRDAGMNDYLAKPFRPNELASLLALHLRHDRRLVRALASQGVGASQAWASMTAASPDSAATT